jgi:hypothetical protein
MFKFYICRCCLYGTHRKKYLNQHEETIKHIRNKVLSYYDDNRYIHDDEKMYIL